MPDKGLYVYTSGEWVTRGAVVTPPPDDDFVLGTTIPTWSNAGYISEANGGGARTTSSITSISTPNQTFTNVDFQNRVDISTSGLTFDNCRFITPGYVRNGSNSGATVMMLDAACADIVFNRCHFEQKAGTATPRTDGLKGHGFTANRCSFKHVVDAVGVFNLYGPRNDVYVHGCIADEFAWFSDDTPVHSDGTHNDFVQIQGSAGLEVIGNAVYGYRWSETETVPVNKPQASQAFVLSWNANTNGPLGDITLSKNFFWGCDTILHASTSKGGGVGGGNAAFAITAEDNKIMKSDQYDYGGSLHYYTLRVDDNAILNGRTYPSGGGVSTTDVFGNVYDTGSDVALEYRGAAWKVRADVP